MDTQPSPVIVVIRGSSTAACVHHRDFPEIRGEGSTPKEAATHLVLQLSRALDTALTNWRRDRVNLAIADVQAFVDQEP
jgi:hypothetical protein